MTTTELAHALTEITNLPFLERSIVSRRFGLCATEPVEVHVVATQMNMSEESVREVGQRALEQLVEAAAKGST